MHTCIFQAWGVGGPIIGRPTPKPEKSNTHIKVFDIFRHFFYNSVYHQSTDINHFTIVVHTLCHSSKSVMQSNYTVTEIYTYLHCRAASPLAIRQSIGKTDALNIKCVKIIHFLV